MPKVTPIAGRNPFQFGEIPGFPVGHIWRSRRELCNDGVHAGISKGINGREAEGAFSVVISGGYEDDKDCGDIITYTGEGGQENKRVAGVKWTAEQIRDQVWKKGNRAMQISHLNNRPLRVIRGSGLDSPYAPAQGYRYDGLYSVRSAVTVRGKNGFAVCQFKLVRRPNQPPLPVAHPRPRPKKISPPVQVPSSTEGEGSSSSQPIAIDSTPENSEDESESGSKASDQVNDFSDLEPF